MFLKTSWRTAYRLSATTRSSSAAWCSRRAVVSSSTRHTVPRAVVVAIEATSRVEEPPSSTAAAAWAAALAAAVTAGAATDRLLCEHKQQQQQLPPRPVATSIASSSSAFTPASVAKEDLSDYQKDESALDKMPCITAKQMAENNGEGGRPVWMSYGGIVYDVTDFIHNHPGGSEKIMLAAGTAMEPFWHVYRQHFSSDLPMRLMEHMAIGRLDQADQDAIDEEMAILEKDDPYAREPLRHKALRVHTDAPMNAETPGHLLTRSFLTPNSLFYIRHHHPVPYLTEKQVQKFQLIVDVSAYKKGADEGQGGKVLRLSLDQLKAMPKTTVTATLQCSGNRRSGFNSYQRTSGTPWGQGAVSTATFGGVRLKDLLQAAGLDDPVAAQDQYLLNHVRFSALDGMMASIGIEKATSHWGDVIVAYEMNGEEIPRDHGYPLRVIVPGYAAVRSVKWVSRIALAEEQAEGPWQRGLNYKILPPSMTDAKGVDLEKMPSVTELSLVSGITHMHPVGAANVTPGDRVTVNCSGWAFAGGGRNVVRVDLTGDDGKTWATAQLLQGSEQRVGRAWAWTFWECEVRNAVVHEDGTVRLASKAVDLALNVQPESSIPTWNVRGLANNSWYRAHVKVCDTI